MSAEPVQVQALTFTGVKSLSQAVVERLREKFEGDTFPRNQLAEICAGLRSEYQDAGFFKAEIGAPEVTEAAGASGKLRKVSVVIPVVVEGKRYTLAAITFRKNTRFASPELRKLFPINDGEVFDVRQIRKGLDAVRFVYADAGYINMSPAPDTVPDDAAATIRVTIYIDEGKQFALGSHGPIERASKAGARQIAEFWRAHQGQPFPEEELENLVLKLAAKGDISPCADPAANLVLRKNEAQGTVEVDFDFPDAHMICEDGR